MFLRRKGIVDLAKNYLNITASSKRFGLRNVLFSTSTAVDGGIVLDESQQEEILQKRLRTTFDDEIKDNGVVPPFKRALLYGSKIAIKDAKEEVSYARLYGAAKRLSVKISNKCGTATNSKQSRIGFICANDR